jgi:hypothetical protein
MRSQRGDKLLEVFSSACVDDIDLLGQSRGPMHRRRNTTHQNELDTGASASSKRSKSVIPVPLDRHASTPRPTAAAP